VSKVGPRKKRRKKKKEGKNSNNGEHSQGVLNEQTTHDWKAFKETECDTVKKNPEVQKDDDEEKGDQKGKVGRDA